ncbi:type II toxin-antitoxin system RelE/ParE family toxin [Pyxidicoccus caerfyrddinensis]|uniref:type II toxin-antitoxin system RelE/ParE family toxin n=1 Tax=Pyxidicoccus caerfyrddinensis TaxID=2709663 RepID=UPI0013D9669C|nr:type II toxin-antitoxin system RelE/ParE family toxin [Pyxidicoccus caerfyrddinensis]
MKPRISFYETSGGGRPVRKYLHALDEQEAAPLLVALRNIETHGFKGTTVVRRVVKGKLWELKLGRHRIFYVLAKGPELVLLHACKKQGRRARKQDVEVASARMKEVLEVK